MVGKHTKIRTKMGFWVVLWVVLLVLFVLILVGPNVSSIPQSRFAGFFCYSDFPLKSISGTLEVQKLPFPHLSALNSCIFRRLKFTQIRNSDHLKWQNFLNFYIHQNWFHVKSDYLSKRKILKFPQCPLFRITLLHFIFQIKL